MSSNPIESILTNFMNSRGNNAQLTATEQNYINTIKSGDSSKGEELATNLCNSMGMSKEQAIAQARQFFGI